jgi:hypothetical protein
MQTKNKFGKGAYAKPPFISKGYYVPVVLSNGVDFCQLDFSGSMSWEEHIKGYVSYWYKKGRPAASDPMGIVKLIYWYISEQGPVQIGDFSQRFDPLTAKLLTTVSAYKFEMQIETFLTEDHTLVELFRITKCEEKGAKLRLALYFARKTYTNKLLNTLDPVAKQIEVLRDKAGTPFFRYSYGDEFEGVGVSSLKVLKGNAKKDSPAPFQEVGERETNLVVSGLKKGDVFYRATSVVDNMDCPDFEEAAWKINRKYMKMSWKDIEASHGKTWRSYHGHSSFECPDEDISRQFALSLTVCKSALHPDGSTVSALEIPNNHEMGTYWDIWFSHRALLNANRVEEAMRIVEFWDSSYPGALAQAKNKYSVNGARFAWVLGANGLPMSDGHQIHNNIIPLINIWDQYCFTMDRAIIGKRFKMMEDCVRFVIEFALKQSDCGPYLKELISIDESGKKKRNELLTAIITLRGIEILKAAAALLSRPVSDDILNADPALRDVLKSLETKQGYAPYEGGGSGSWGNVVPFIHSPDKRKFSKSIDFALAGCEEAYGLNVGRTSRMRCATFPWVEGIFAWAMLRNNDRRAKKYFLNMQRFTNFHGGFAEHIWIHGEPSREWFVAAHGVFVVALTEFIAQMREGVLVALPLGIKSLPFKSFKVANIRLEGAWLLSAELSSGGELTVEIRNGLAQKRTLELLFPVGNLKTFKMNSKACLKKTIQLIPK